MVGVGQNYTVVESPRTSIHCEALARDWRGESEAVRWTVIVQNRCGDGFAVDEESCDDGNADNHDTCLNSCVQARCGDGLVQHGVEACDTGADGNGCVECRIAPRYSCDGTAPSQCSTRCGDGHRDADEECDPRADGDDCSSGCMWISQCGNGRLEGDEQCDDGNVYGDDGCTAECLINRVDFDCQEIHASTVNIQAHAQPKTGVLIDDVVYWLRGARLLERYVVATGERSHRFFDGVLAGRPLIGLHAHGQSLILHVGSSVDGVGESLWRLSPSVFQSAAPQLVHEAAEISPSGRYDAIHVLQNRLLVQLTDEEHSHLVDLAPWHRHGLGCLPNTGCGYRHRIMMGQASIGQWAMSE